MRFLIDECTGPSVARWLEAQGFFVFSVFDDARGTSDVEILSLAQDQHFILITNDKDFGDLIVREKRTHPGVILLRLSDERAHNKITVLDKLLKNHIDDLANNFTIVTDSMVRIISKDKRLKDRLD